MQRLIQIEFRHRYVILEAAWNWIPSGVNRSENCVAITNGLDQDSNTYEIIYLIELAAAHDHLLIDAVVLLRTTCYLSLDLLRL